MFTADPVVGLGQVAINVKQTERAVAFYRDTVGLKYLFSAGKLAFFDCGGVRLMLTPAEKPEFDHSSSILYFKVPDLEASHSRLLADGAQIESEPHLVAKMPDHDLWMSFFRDSEGNLMALMCEKR